MQNKSLPSMAAQKTNDKCEQLFQQITDINQLLISNLDGAADNSEQINQYITKRLSLLKDLMQPDNENWHSANSQRLLKLQSDVKQVELSYTQKRDDIRNKIHQQKQTNKGVNAYKNAR